MYDTELIYKRYLKAFKKGVYNYIKEESDPMTQEMIPRKYFSGGAEMGAAMITTDFAQTIDPAEISDDLSRIGSFDRVIVNFDNAEITQPGHNVATIDYFDPNDLRPKRQYQELSPSFMSVHPLKTEEVRFHSSFADGMKDVSFMVYPKPFKINVESQQVVESLTGNYFPQGKPRSSMLYVGGSAMDCLVAATRSTARYAFEHGIRSFTAYWITEGIWLESKFPSLENIFIQAEQGKDVFGLFDDKQGRPLKTGELLIDRISKYYSIEMVNRKNRDQGELLLNPSTDDVVIKLGGQIRTAYKSPKGKHVMIIDFVRPSDNRLISHETNNVTPAQNAASVAKTSERSADNAVLAQPEPEKVIARLKEIQDQLEIIRGSRVTFKYEKFEPYIQIGQGEAGRIYIDPQVPERKIFYKVFHKETGINELRNITYLNENNIPDVPRA